MRKATAAKQPRKAPRRPDPPRPASWTLASAGPLQVLEAARLAELDWLVHAFSTRPGGQSRLGGKNVLNLGFADWDSRAAVLANRGEFLAALGAEKMHLVTLRQFHSDLVHHITEPPAQTPRGDAAVTRTPGLLLSIETADCVPILLVDPSSRGVAAVHAGWRGTLRRIAAKTLGQMRMLFGTRPEEVVAALGPGIGRCCYEVGPEVVQAFAGAFAASQEWFEGLPGGAARSAAKLDPPAGSEEPSPLEWLSRMPPGHEPPPRRLHLDLAAANRWQLLDAGLKPANIVASELCTACRTDLFFSYRRERGTTGRLMGVVGIRP